MKSEYDISHIAALLQRFYDGSSSPDDESLLANFFADADPNSLPAELRADAELFRGLDAIRAEAEDVQMPQELTRSLDKIMSPPLAATINVGQALRRYVSIGAAAAVVVALSVAALTLTMPIRLTDAAEMVAKAPTGDTAVVEAVEHHQPQAGATPAPLVAHKTPTVVSTHAKKSRVVASRPKATTEIYREVTDLDEAQAIVERCGRLLAFGASQSRCAGQQVVDNLTEVYQTIQNI